MKRLALIVIATLLLAGVTFHSLLLTPSATQSRLSAVPAHAHVVYSNKDPDWFLSFFATPFGHCPASAEPLSLRSGPILGKTTDEFSKHWNKRFQCLENAPLIVATVPFAGREQRDTWVAVSELGGPAALALRWRLTLFPPEGVSPARPYAVWPVWTFEHSSIPSWARVRFSITESLLICAISADSHDICRLLDVADGRAASMMD